MKLVLDLERQSNGRIRDEGAYAKYEARIYDGKKTNGRASEVWSDLCLVAVQ